MEFRTNVLRRTKGWLEMPENEPVALKGDMRDVRASEEKLQRAHQSGSARQIDLFSAAAELEREHNAFPLCIFHHTLWYNYYDVLLIEK